MDCYNKFSTECLVKYFIISVTHWNAAAKVAGISSSGILRIIAQETSAWDKSILTSKTNAFYRRNVFWKARAVLCVAVYRSAWRVPSVIVRATGGREKMFVKIMKWKCLENHSQITVIYSRILRSKKAANMSRSWDKSFQLLNSTDERRELHFYLCIETLDKRAIQTTFKRQSYSASVLDIVDIRACTCTYNIKKLLTSCLPFPQDWSSARVSLIT